MTSFTHARHIRFELVDPPRPPQWSGVAILVALVFLAVFFGVLALRRTPYEEREWCQHRLAQAATAADSAWVRGRHQCQDH